MSNLPPLVNLTIEELLARFAVERAKRIDDKLREGAQIGRGVRVVTSNTGTDVAVSPMVPAHHVYEFPGWGAWETFVSRQDS